MNNFPAMTEEHRDSLIDWAKGYIYAAEIYVASNPADRSGKAYLELLQIALGALTAKSIAWIETGTDGFQRGSRLINYFTSDIQGFDNGTLIYAAPTAPVLRVPDGWVKCSERMPELDTKVLLLFTQYDNHIEDGFIGDEGDDVGWYHYLYDGDALQSNPTHWMPLPSLPEASNE